MWKPVRLLILPALALAAPASFLPDAAPAARANSLDVAPGTYGFRSREAGLPVYYAALSQGRSAVLMPNPAPGTVAGGLPWIVIVY